MAQLGNAVYEFGNFFAKIFFNFIQGNFGIFRDVVQQGGREGWDVGKNLAQNYGCFPAVNKIVLAAFTLLACVRFLRQQISMFNYRLLLGRKFVGNGV